MFVRHSGHLREHVYGAVAAADPAGGRQGPQRLLGSLLLEGHWISSFLRARAGWRHGDQLALASGCSITSLATASIDVRRFIAVRFSQRRACGSVIPSWVISRPLARSMTLRV